MVKLTFGEQVKIILSRKGMTIKELAETIQKRTGKKMSRQNLTQRLGRDNFQEQDMRMIAEILGCPFSLSILGDVTRQEEKAEPAKGTPAAGKAAAEVTAAAKENDTVKDNPAAKEKLQEEEAVGAERDITIGELVDIHKELDALAKENALEENAAEEETLKEDMPAEETPKENAPEENAPEEEIPEENIPEEVPEEAADQKPHGIRTFLQRKKKKQKSQQDESDESGEDTGNEDAQSGEAADRNFEGAYADEMGSLGDVNPYTGMEYESNSVRMHPKRIGYVQVYDREQHTWTDMTEWAFLGYQERKKALLGKDYEPPIYLD